MSAHRVNRAAALGVAGGGVLLGHWLTYRVVTPDAQARAAELTSTGHGYLGYANELGFALALTALAAVFLGRLTQHRGGTPGLGSLTGRLAAFQLVAFGAMEVVERVSTGAPVSGLLNHGLVLVGIAAQLAVAGLGALAIRWLLRAADLAEGVLATAAPPDRRGAVPLLLPPSSIPPRPVLAVAGIRGPPHVR